MDGGHFRRQNSECAPHFRGKFRFRIQDGRHRSFFLHPFSDGGLERAQADADRTEVHALIDFQGGVEPVSFRHDLLHLVGDNCIEAAAEGIEFHQFQIGMAGDIVGGAVETAVPGPLVQYAERGKLAVLHHGNAVFGKDGHSQLVDQIGDAVVDRRVCMVGTAGQHDPDKFLLFDFLQDTLRFQIQLHLVFFSGGFCFTLGGGNFTAGYFEGSENPFQYFMQFCRMMERQEGMEKAGAVFREDFIHIGLDGFRVGCDHGAVEGVGSAFIGAFVDAGVPDEIRFSPGQVIDVGMGQFDGEAFGVGRDGFHGFGGDAADLSGRSDDTVAETGEKSMPIREILVHIHRSGDTHGSSCGFLGGQALPVENFVIFPAVYIGQGGMGRCLSGEHDGGASFAAVARDK